MVESKDLSNKFPRNHWYAIYESKNLKNKSTPIRIKRFTKELVLWRDHQNKTVCHSAYCPHRGADLGFGKIVEHRSTEGKIKTLECEYHGFRFGCDSESSVKCLLAPCEGANGKIHPGLRLDTYPIKEAQGLIWMWWGDKQEHYPDVPWTEEIPPNYQSSASDTMIWNVSFVRTMESMLDLHHLPFLHSKALPNIGSYMEPFDAWLEDENDCKLIRSKGELKADPKFENPKKRKFKFSSTVIFPSLMYAEFLKGVTLLALSTPIDENKTWVLGRYYQDIVKLPIIDKFTSWLFLVLDLKAAQPDDHRALSNSHPQYPGKHDNNLVHADKGIALWHQLYNASCQ